MAFGWKVKASKQMAEGHTSRILVYLHLHYEFTAVLLDRSLDPLDSFVQPFNGSILLKDIKERALEMNDRGAHLVCRI